eukprot:13810958-Alexandrium_andersonii.AAC.1
MRCFGNRPKKFRTKAKDEDGTPNSRALVHHTRNNKQVAAKGATLRPAAGETKRADRNRPGCPSRGGALGRDPERLIYDT